MIRNVSHKPTQPKQHFICTWCPIRKSILLSTVLLNADNKQEDHQTGGPPNISTLYKTKMLLKMKCPPNMHLAKDWIYWVFLNIVPLLKSKVEDEPLDVECASIIEIMLTYYIVSIMGAIERNTLWVNSYGNQNSLYMHEDSLKEGLSCSLLLF